MDQTGAGAGWWPRALDLLRDPFRAFAAGEAKQVYSARPIHITHMVITTRRTAAAYVKLTDNWAGRTPDNRASPCIVLIACLHRHARHRPSSLFENEMLNQISEVQR